MSRKAFIIGRGPFRLRTQTYFWSSLNYLGSYRESQERELQEPSRCLFKSLCRNMNFTFCKGRALQTEELRHCPYLRKYPIYTSYYHIYAWYKPFYTQKEKKIAVDNRWLTDSSVVSEKLKVKEEIKILEDYYVMTWNNRGWTQDEVIWLHLKGVTFHYWPGTCPYQAPLWEERIRKAKNGGDETAKNWRGKRAEWWTLPLPRLPLFSLRSLTFFFLPRQELLPSPIFFFRLFPPLRNLVPSFFGMILRFCETAHLPVP